MEKNRFVIPAKDLQSAIQHILKNLMNNDYADGLNDKRVQKEILMTAKTIFKRLKSGEYSFTKEDVNKLFKNAQRIIISCTLMDLVNKGELELSWDGSGEFVFSKKEKKE